jgi:hypothetical protein
MGVLMHLLYKFRKVNDGQWGWRALRLLAKKSPHFFTYGNNPIGKLNEYLETMLRKMSPSLQQSLSSQTTGNIRKYYIVVKLVQIIPHLPSSTTSINYQ